MKEDVRRYDSMTGDRFEYDRGQVRVIYVSYFQDLESPKDTQ